MNRNLGSRLRLCGMILLAYCCVSAVAVALFDVLRDPPLLQEDRTTMWRLTPGYQGPSATDWPEGTAEVDDRGRRVIPRALSADERTSDPAKILTIGDSFTFGWGVDDGETWPAQLQATLDDLFPGLYEVVNAGFPGCSSYQALQGIDSWMDEVEPEFVVMLLGRNDGRRAFSTDHETHRRLRFKPPGANYVLPGMFYNYRTLQSLAKRRGAEPTSRVGAEEFEENIRGLLDNIRGRGSTPVLIEHWTADQRSTRRIAQRRGIPWIPGPELLNRARERSGEELFIKAHHHPNGKGYAVLAPEIASAILTAPRTPAARASAASQTPQAGEPPQPRTAPILQAGVERPNLILISLDTLRADRLGAYGAEGGTPRLDRFAAEGALFENAFSQAPNTLPSHASIFLSQYPLTHGVYQGKDNRISEQAVTVTEVLRDAGYRTAAFTAGGLMSAKSGFGQGFEAYDDEYESAEEKNPKVLEWLKKLRESGRESDEEPFFLFLHYYDVHFPYDAVNPYGPNLAEGLPENPALTNSRSLDSAAANRALREATADDVLLINRLYDNGVRYMDRQLGVVLDALEQSGAADRTYVLITSDHGETLFDHGSQMQHGRFLWDELLHVPLLVRGPGIPSGIRLERMVQGIDLAPTLLRLAGLEVPSSMEGRSFLRDALGESPSDVAGKLFAQARLEGAFDRRTVRTPSWKLIYDVGKKQAQLFDLAADPAERREVSTERPRILRELIGEMRRWDRLCRESEEYLVAVGRGGAETDPAKKKELEALGYL